MFGKRLETFEEYMQSLDPVQRGNHMELFAKYGDPEQVLRELYAISPCCRDKNREVRINEKYLLWYMKKTFTKDPAVYLFDTASIKYCYYSCCRNGDYGKIGWFNIKGEDMYFGRLDKEATAAIAQTLLQYVHGFDTFSGKPVQDGKLIESFDSLHFLYFQGNTLYARKLGEITKKPKDSVDIRDIQEIIWVDQWYTWDSEASDSYALDVYMSHINRPVTLHSGSEIGAFMLAVELKKRIPHLLYGPSEEYKKLHRKDPAQLMALAKSKVAPRG